MEQFLVYLSCSNKNHPSRHYVDVSVGIHRRGIAAPNPCHAGIHAIEMWQMITILLTNNNRHTIRKIFAKKCQHQNLTRNIPPCKIVSWLRSLYPTPKLRINQQRQKIYEQLIQGIIMIVHGSIYLESIVDSQIDQDILIDFNIAGPLGDHKMSTIPERLIAPYPLGWTLGSCEGCRTPLQQRGCNALAVWQHEAHVQASSRYPCGWRWMSISQEMASLTRHGQFQWANWSAASCVVSHEVIVLKRAPLLSSHSCLDPIDSQAVLISTILRAMVI